jgi:myosin heavy subunit
LDEECNFPKGTDQSFLEKVTKNFQNNKVYKKPLRTQGVFAIVHFAGEVIYDTTGFLEKNKDTVHGDLVTLMQGSTDAFVQSIFPQETKPKDKLAPKVAVPTPGRPGNTAAKKVTLAGQFRVCRFGMTSNASGSIGSFDEHHIVYRTTLRSST